jgi:hypothetical protein
MTRDAHQVEPRAGDCPPQRRFYPPFLSPRQFFQTRLECRVSHCLLLPRDL